MTDSLRYRSREDQIFDAFAAILTRIDNLEQTMTVASDNLSAKITDLTSAVTDALVQVESEIATIKSTDDSVAVNASADKIGSLTATIRAALTTAQSELAPAVAAPVAAADPVSEPVTVPVVADATAPEPTAVAGAVPTDAAVPAPEVVPSAVAASSGA